MRTIAALLLFASLSCNAAMEVSADTPVVKLLECLRANAPSQLQIADLRIDAQGAGVSTRFLSGKFYSRRDERGLRAMLHITAPSDLAGIRYLLVEAQPDDELYLYLPALGKVRRVSGSSTDAQIAGTPLNYADLRLLSQALSAAAITRDARVTYAGRGAQRLRFTPAIADSPYRRVMATVDEQTCTLLRAEFQDAQRTVKEYRADPDSLMQSGRYRYASRATLEDLVQGSKAQLSLGGVSDAPRLSSRLFDPRRFCKD